MARRLSANVGFWILATPFFLLTLTGFVASFSQGSGIAPPENEARYKLAWSRVAEIKSHLRDPDGFALESVHVPRADIVCIKYLARDGSGGMNRESIIVDGARPYQSSNDDGRFPQMWSELCAASESWNFTDRVKVSL